MTVYRFWIRYRGRPTLIIFEGRERVAFQFHSHGRKFRDAGSAGKAARWWHKMDGGLRIKWQDQYCPILRCNAERWPRGANWKAFTATAGKIRA